MKVCTLLLALTPLALLSSPTLAANGPRLNCDDLKAKIEAKFQQRGVKNYSLEAVEQKADAGADMVVGTCDGNTKKMLYKRTSAAAAEPKAAAKIEAPKAEAPKAEASKADAKAAAPASKADPTKPAGK